MHSRFRLWLSTESHPGLPKLLLQQSLKVSFEPSPGLSHGVQRVLNTLGPAEFDSVDKLSAQLMFVLAWIHSIVEERKQYVPQGWTKPYEFSIADLRAGQDIIKRALRACRGDVERVPWQELHGLLSLVAYGGRLDNVYDQKVLLTFIKASFGPGLLRGGKALCRGVPMLETASFDRAREIFLSIPFDSPPSMLRLPDNVGAAQVQGQVDDLKADLREFLGASKPVDGA